MPIHRDYQTHRSDSTALGQPAHLTLDARTAYMLLFIHPCERFPPRHERCLMRKLLFVQPLYSAHYIVEYLRQHFDITALFVKDPRPLFALNESMYHSCELMFDKSDSNILERFSKGDFDFVINGTDESEEIACKLANKICPELANEVDPLNRRWNKYESIEAMRAHGLDVPWQTCVNASEILDGTINSEQLLFPCFVKPVNFFGGIGSGVCHSLADARELIASTPPEVCGLNLREVLFQEIFRGNEYALDCFSWKGQHDVAFIARYVKHSTESGRTYYRSIEPIPANDDLYRRIVEYTRSVLDAVGFKFGFSHIEIFHDPSATNDLHPPPGVEQSRDKFSLVEINPRASGLGGQLMHCAKLFRNFNILDILLEKVCQVPYERNPSGLFVDMLTLYANDQRVLRETNLPALQQIQSIASHVRVRPMGYVATNDYTLADAVMFVTLANANREQLERDRNAMFEFERKHVLF